MTFSQTYYRMVFEKYGLTDEAFKKCSFAANLIVQFKIDDIWNELYPQRPVLLFNPTQYLELEIFKNHFKDWSRIHWGTVFK